MRIRVGGNVAAANLTHQVAPVYPLLAKTAHITGTVVLHCIIAKDGTVKEVEFVSGPPLLMRSAMDAVRQWTYQPTLLNGQPIEVDTTVSVVFTLGNTPAGPGSDQSQQTPSTSPTQAPGGKTSGEVFKLLDISQDPFVYQQVRGTMRYENDGTGTLETKVRLKVQSSQGVEKVGQLVFGYNSANERLDVVSVVVIKPDGTKIVSGPDAVQDLSAPVALQAPMYSDARQKHVTVAGFAVGDTLEYDTINTTVKPLTPGQFWQTWNFVYDGRCLDEQVELNVPANRTLKIKSPPDVTPTSHTEGDRRIYVWKTTTDHAVESPLPGFPNMKNLDPAVMLRGVPAVAHRHVSFSTFENWAQVGQWYSSLESQRRVASPEVKARAGEITKGATTDAAKAQALYQWVTRNIRYVSLSFGVGRYQPHFASEVLTNRYGDCKDKATLLDALLAAEGIRSSTALISTQFDLDPDVPAPSQFDHAISFVSLDGKDIWLDSTTQVAPYEYLLPQLRGKDALVVFADHPAEIRKTHADLQFPKYYRFDVDGSIAGRKLDVRVAFETRGDIEVIARSAMLALPADKLAELMAQGAKVSAPDSDTSFTELKAGDPFDTTKPFRIEIHMKQATPEPATASATSKSNKSDAKDALKFLLPEPPSPAAPLSLYGPKEMVLKVKLDVAEAKDIPKFQPVHLTTDFAQFDASGSVENHVVAIDVDLNIRASEISAAQLPQYTRFRDDVVEKMTDFVNSLKRAKPPAASAADSSVSSSSSSSSTDHASPTDEEEARRLYRSGIKAMKDGKYRDAVALLETSTARDPHSSSAFNELGRAYLQLNELPQAVVAFRKATEVNPEDPYAFNNLGLALMREKKFDEAVPAFQKQLEINPWDGFAHPNLGRLYMQTKQYDKAVAEFEIAAKSAPEDATLAANLGEAYAKANQPEKALQCLDHALELSPIPSMQNTVAWEMAEMNSHLDRAETIVKSAIASVSADTNSTDLSALSRADTGRMFDLAAYWDTLGWVKFQAGDIPQAEKYIAAAWGLCEFTAIGDHLGQIYEKEGRKADAITVYEITLAKPAAMPETRPRLAALLPPGADIDAQITEAKTKRSAGEGIKFPNSANVNDFGEVWLLLKPGPTVADVQFINATDALKSTATEIRAIHFPDTFPDATPVTLIRRAKIICSHDSKDCNLSLIPADEVLSVK
ncbi:MAG: TonB family protein [Candidatus Acidiferrales bacterium]